MRVRIFLVFIYSIAALGYTVETTDAGKFKNCKATSSGMTVMCTKEGLKYLFKRTHNGHFVGMNKDKEGKVKVSIATTVKDQHGLLVYQRAVSRDHEEEDFYSPYFSTPAQELAQNAQTVSELFIRDLFTEPLDEEDDEFSKLEEELSSLAEAEVVKAYEKGSPDGDLSISLSDGEKVSCKKQGEPNCHFQKCTASNKEEFYVYKDAMDSNGYIDFFGLTKNGAMTVSRSVSEVRAGDEVVGTRISRSLSPYIKAQGVVPQKYRHVPQTYYNFAEPTYILNLYSMLHACPKPMINKLVKALESFQEEDEYGDLIRMVDVMGDNIKSYFINADLIPEIACFHNGAYYTPEAFKRTREYQSLKSPKTISMKKAKKLFKEARKRDDIAWNFKRDGCYARAHLMARQFEAQGVHVEKAWIRGRLQTGTDTKTTEDDITWGYHVAPVVHVRGKDGIQKMIIDPSVADEPVSVETWLKKMNVDMKKSQLVDFPASENAEIVGRHELAFSTSDPYDPYIDQDLTEQQMMDSAQRVMHAYKNGGDLWF